MKNAITISFKHLIHKLNQKHINFQLTPPYLLPYDFDHLLQYVPLSNLKVHIITTVLYHCLQKLGIDNQKPQIKFQTNEFES